MGKKPKNKVAREPARNPEHHQREHSQQRSHPDDRDGGSSANAGLAGDPAPLVSDEDLDAGLVGVADRPVAYRHVRSPEHERVDASAGSEARPGEHRSTEHRYEERDPDERYYTDYGGTGHAPSRGPRCDREKLAERAEERDGERPSATSGEDKRSAVRSSEHQHSSHGVSYHQPRCYHHHHHHQDHGHYDARADYQPVAYQPAAVPNVVTVQVQPTGEATVVYTEQATLLLRQMKAYDLNHAMTIWQQQQERFKEKDSQVQKLSVDLLESVERFTPVLDKIIKEVFDQLNRDIGKLAKAPEWSKKLRVMDDPLGLAASRGDAAVWWPGTINRAAISSKSFDAFKHSKDVPIKRQATDDSVAEGGCSSSSSTRGNHGPQLDLDVRRLMLRQALWKFFVDKLFDSSRPFASFGGTAGGAVGGLNFADLFPKHYKDPKAAKWRTMTIEQLQALEPGPKGSIDDADVQKWIRGELSIFVFDGMVAPARAAAAKAVSSSSSNSGSSGAAAAPAAGLLLPSDDLAVYDILSQGEIAKHLRQTTLRAIKLSRMLMRERCGFTVEAPDLRAVDFYKTRGDGYEPEPEPDESTAAAAKGRGVEPGLEEVEAMLTAVGGEVGVMMGDSRERDCAGLVRLIGSPALVKWGNSSDGSNLELKTVLVKAYADLFSDEASDAEDSE